MEWKQVSDVIWELPISYKPGMKVPARVYATKNLLQGFDEKVVDQLTNVACLPGIQKYALCMPDGHMGYGFPIGGVAAMDPQEGGVISPGGIGFDINCGMRLIKTNLFRKDIESKVKDLVNELFKTVPAGVGGSGFVTLSHDELKEVMLHGVDWCVKNGYGWKSDPKHIEEGGCIKGGDPSKVSDRALKRGKDQIGTLGSGNHYLEIQYADMIFDQAIAETWGIKKDQAVVMVHCGSRGFGHQIGTDYLRIFEEAMRKYGIHVRDRELACAPFESEEGQDYYKAHICAANLAFSNRQVVVHRIREAFEKVFGRSAQSLGMEVLYDVAHNIAKIESHKVGGKNKSLVMHRKGATRSFGPSREEIGKEFQKTGQPVIIGGSMETGSYLCAGLDGSEETFGSTMHGSGRTMSRHQAKSEVRGEDLQKKMERDGIYVKAVSMSGLAEEAGFAYKDVSEVVQTMHTANVSKKVIALKPLGNVKG
ncbi:RtcB family protein [Candidatus Woesearchaeota archaeon]|nr:RtcB family protein [Candidatus Woesearchaeota archaeon]